MIEPAMPAAVVVVGASGFIGRNVVKALAGRVERLIGITAETRDVPGCSAVSTLDRVAEIGALPADTVLIHVGAFRYDPRRFALAQSDILLHNADLNARVFHFCAERKIAEVRLASSVAVYEGDRELFDDAIPIDLNRPPHAGEAFYAWSKRWGEQLAQLYRDRFGVNSVVFRLSNPYGPHDSIDPNKAHVAPAFVMKALNSDPTFPIRGAGSVERDFIYVGDVVEVLLRSLRWRDRHETYNLATGTGVTLNALAETVMRVAGVSKPIVTGAPGAFGPAARRSTATRIQQAFGLDFADLERGMRPTIEWYRHAFQP